MSRALSTSMNRRYGTARVCRVWKKPRSSVYARRERTKSSSPVPVKRPGPVGKHSDAELLQSIRKVIDASPFHGEGHRKIWARLRHEGTRTSKTRVLRIMRENSLLSPQRGQAREPKEHNGTIVTERPNEMWGTDMTRTITTDEGSAAVFIAVDHCTAGCVGIHAAKEGNRFEALEPIRQGVKENFGEIGRDAANGLALRHDHGSCYLSDHFLNEIKFLGIISSPSFVREPEGNGCAERFIRTLKEQLLWVVHFKTIEELRLALLAFKDRYNAQWLIERNGHRSPADVKAALSSRQEVAA